MRVSTASLPNLIAIDTKTPASRSFIRLHLLDCVRRLDLASGILLTYGLGGTLALQENQRGIGFRDLPQTWVLGDPPTKSPLFFPVSRNGSYQTGFLPKLSTKCTMDITDALNFSHSAQATPPALCIALKVWARNPSRRSHS